MAQNVTVWYLCTLLSQRCRPSPDFVSTRIYVQHLISHEWACHHNAQFMGSNSFGYQRFIDGTRCPMGDAFEVLTRGKPLANDWRFTGCIWILGNMMINCLTFHPVSLCCAVVSQCEEIQYDVLFLAVNFLYARCLMEGIGAAIQQR